VKQETLEWLASSKHATQRFEDAIGRQCRDLPLTRVAELNRLTWDRVRRMEMAYMFRLEARHPPPESIRAIGIDEISVAKGQTYAIVVADLDQKRPIWISREPGRTQADMDMFFVEMGAQRSASIRLAVMDMWKPFRKSTKAQAPNAQIIYDKFHVMTYLGDALDDVRRLEFQNAHALDYDLESIVGHCLAPWKATKKAHPSKGVRPCLCVSRRVGRCGGRPCGV
jgi:transposase